MAESRSLTRDRARRRSFRCSSRPRRRSRRWRRRRRLELRRRRGVGKRLVRGDSAIGQLALADRAIFDLGRQSTASFLSLPVGDRVALDLVAADLASRRRRSRLPRTRKTAIDDITFAYVSRLANLLHGILLGLRAPQEGRQPPCSLRGSDKTSAGSTVKGDGKRVRPGRRSAAVGDSACSAASARRSTKRANCSMPASTSPYWPAA